MKKKLLILALSTLLMIGCSSKNGPTNQDGSSDNNPSADNNPSFSTDDDPMSDISDGGTSNEYDADPFIEDDIATPTEYDGTNVTEIVNPGKYYLSGTLGKINITVAKNKVVYLFLDGVSVSTQEGIALASENKITAYIVLLNGSENTFVNDYVDTNAIHIKGDIHILGNGTLNVESKQKNGLKASKDLYVSGANVTINATGANHAISARSITATDATINVIAKGKDGIQLEVDGGTSEFTLEEGFAKLKNIKFTADTYGDGIQANTYLYISGGTYNITTHGVFVPYTDGNKTTYELEDKDFKFVASDDSYKRVATDEIRTLTDKYYALTQSTKGLKVSEIEVDEGYAEGDYKLYIAHGAKVTISSTDDCIYANYGNVVVEESNLFLYTFDDGVHADYNVDVKNSRVEISRSYEGLEGAVVTVDGDDTNIVIYAEDDGINAASDLSNTNNIYIKAGYLRVYASGDGLDANTALYLQGGKVIVEGPGRDNGSLDAEQIYFEGGIVFACSTNGMRERMTATQNAFVYQGQTTMYAGNEVSIVDSENNNIYSYELRQSCTQIIFSSSALTLHATYKIMYRGNALATFEMTSSVTNVGNSGGPGGGGHGGHPSL